MKLSISNIAWSRDEEKTMARVLRDLDVNFVEIAPTTIWQDPTKVSQRQIESYKNFWLKHNIQIIAMQSLLYGHPELLIFSSPAVRKKTLGYLAKIMKLASKIGAKRLVFGSPKNRSTEGFEKDSVLKISLEFFTKVADLAKEHNVIFCIEPNPKQYSCNFINTTKEAIALIRQVNKPSFRLHLDSACLTLAQDPIRPSIKLARKYLTHFHISEPYLNKLNSGRVNHKLIAGSLRKIKYGGFVSIEMKARPRGSNLENILSSLKYAKKLY